MLFRFLIILVFTTCSYAQQMPLDSLRQLFETKSGTERIDLLNEMAFEAVYSDPEQGKKYAEEAFLLSEQAGYEKGIATAWQNIGVNLWGLGQYLSSLEIQERALEKFQALRDTVGIIESLIDIGIIYADLGKYDQGLEYYFQVVRLSEAIGDQDRVFKAYNNIGVVYLELGQPEMGIQYFRKAEEQFPADGIKTTLLAITINIGTIYIDLKQYEDADLYFQRALSLCDETGDEKGRAIIYMNVGTLRLLDKQYEEALSYYNQALAIAEKMKDLFGIAQAYSSIASVYTETKEVSRAFNYYDKALKLSQEINSPILVQENSYNLTELYKQRGNYQKALDYFEMYATAKDTIYTAQSAKQIAELQLKYEIDQKENEIELLKSEKAIQEYKIKQHRTAGIILAVGLVAVCIFGLIVFWFYRQKVQANKQLLQANSQIQKQQRELRKINKKQEKLLQELSETNTTKDKFFSIIAHDLKNPLQTQLSGSRLLADSIDTIDKDTIKEIAQGLKQNTRKLFELLENLLQWSRIQMDSLEHKPQNLELAALINKWIDLLRENAKQKSITLTSNIDDSLCVHADMNMLSSTIQNIITNSIKFSNEGGRVTIDAAQQNGNVEIIIRDTGIGISPEKLKKLFRIDESVSTAGTADEKGTGLGLILSKEFIMKNGGDLWIESTAGKGTSVHFTLPNSAD